MSLPAQIVGGSCGTGGTWDLVVTDSTTTCLSYTDGNGSHYDCSTTTYYTWDCLGGGGTSGGDPTGGGGPTPDPPQISIVSMNDENPGAPVMQVQTNSVVTKIDMRINGNPQNSYPGGTTSIILPTLNPVGGTPFNGVDNSIELIASNTIGSTASAYLGISRPTNTVSNQGGIYARYYIIHFPEGEVEVGQTNLTRSLSVFAKYTNYSCTTVGARNGKVFHWQTEDVLGWTDLLPTELVWSAYYSMKSLPLPQNFDEQPCSARFAGPSNQNGLCAQPASFAVEQSPGASGIIYSVGIGSYLQKSTELVGATTIGVLP